MVTFTRASSTSGTPFTHPLSIFGRTYLTYESLLNRYNQPPIFTNQLIQLHENQRRIEAFLLHVLTTGFSQRTYKGYNLLDICKYYGIEPHIVKKRLALGWSLEKTVITKVGIQEKENAFMFKGHRYANKRDLIMTNGFSYDFVKEKSRDLNLDTLETLDLLVEFFKPIKGNRPKIITSIPAVIYNDVWYTTLNEFTQVVNINKSAMTTALRKLRLHKKEQANHAYLEASAYLVDKTVDRLVDNQTQEVLSQRDLTERYKVSSRTLLDKGYARKETLKMYPNLNFHLDTNKCNLETKRLFNEYLKSKGLTIDRLSKI